jgi:hypothetical protein
MHIRNDKWTQNLVGKLNRPGELARFRQYSVWLQTGRLRFEPRQRQRTFPVSSVSRPALRPTHPPVQWVPGSFTMGKARPGRDADHSPPSSAKVRRCTSSPPKRLHGVLWDSFNFYYSSKIVVVYIVTWSYWWPVIVVLRVSCFVVCVLLFSCCESSILKHMKHG